MDQIAAIIITIGNTINPNGELNFIAAAVSAIFSYLAFKRDDMTQVKLNLFFCVLNVVMGTLGFLVS